MDDAARRPSSSTSSTHAAMRQGLPRSSGWASRSSRRRRERVVATMPVAGNTQPYGLLHGGASVVLAETLGSIGATLHAGAGRHRGRPRHQRHPPPRRAHGLRHRRRRPPCRLGRTLASLRRGRSPTRSGTARLHLADHLPDPREGARRLSQRQRGRPRGDRAADPAGSAGRSAVRCAPRAGARPQRATAREHLVEAGAGLLAGEPAAQGAGAG